MNNEWYVQFVMHINDPDSATWGVFATGYQLEAGNGTGGALCGYTDFGSGTGGNGMANLDPGGCTSGGLAPCPSPPTNRYGAWAPPSPHPSHDALLATWFDYPDTPQPHTYTATLKALLDPCGPRPTIATGSVDVQIP
jgi:hypothetical protein